MSLNWFDNHPVKSIILYTLTISVVTWGGVFFLLDERRERLHKTEMELLQIKLDRNKMIESQLKARVEVLKDENSKLRVQNLKFYEWISNNPSTVEFIKKENDKLRNKLVVLKKEQSNQLIFENPERIKEFLIDKYSVESPSLKDGSVFMEEFTGTSVIKYSFESPILKEGNAFIDELTGASLSVTDISILNDADGHFNFPEGAQQDFNNVKPGTSWTFKYKGRRFDLYLQQIDYATDTYKVRVKEK